MLKERDLVTDASTPEDSAYLVLGYIKHTVGLQAIEGFSIGITLAMRHPEYAMRLHQIVTTLAEREGISSDGLYALVDAIPVHVNLASYTSE